MSDLKVSLILQLKNLLGRGIGQVRGELRGLKSEAQGLSSIKGPNTAGIERYGRSAREAASALRQLKRDQAVLGHGRVAGGAAGNTILAGAGRAGLALGGLYAARRAAGATVGQSVSFEKAMAQVRKKVDAPDEAGFQRLEGTINQIAKDYGLARAQVAELTAEAGASGIAFQDLERFMRMTAKAAVAWDMSPGEAAQKLAEIKTGTQQTIAELETMAEKINGLGDNSAAKERDIVEMFGRSGAAAKAANVSFDVTLAALTAVRSTGLQPEIAARWFSAFTGGLRTIEEGSKKAKEGLKLLGLDAAKVAKGMKTDSLGTMLDIFDRLQKSPEGAKAAIKIFGQQWWDETSRAAQALPELKKQLEYLKSGKWEGSLNKTLNIELQTTANHLERLKALTSEIGDRMGRWALPPLNATIDGLVKKYDELKERLEARKKPEVDEDRKKLFQELDAKAKDREAWKRRTGNKDLHEKVGEFLFGKTLTKDPARKLGEQLGGGAADADALAKKQTEEAAILRIQAKNAKKKEDRVRLNIEAGKKEQEAQANANAAAMAQRAAGQAAGRDMTNVEAGMQQLGSTGESRRGAEIAALKAQIATLSSKLLHTSSNPFGAPSAGKPKMEAELATLQERLKTLEGQAEQAGAAVKDKLTMDLTSEGNRAATSFAAGFTTGSGPAIAAAQALAGQIRATLSSPPASSPASGGRPLSGGSANAGLRGATVQVGGITVNGVNDPEKAARIVEQRLASSIRSSLSGAHHDGVT